MDDRDLIQAAEDPRPLTPGDFQALIQGAELAIARHIRALDPTGRFQPSSLRIADAIYRGIRDSQRPEGAEKVEAVLHQYWSGDINGDDLADRIAEEMNR